jgi:hypothetical protein
VYASKPGAVASDPGAPFPGLEITVYVLNVAQVPLISLDGMEKATLRVSGTLGFATCSGTNTATVRLALPGRTAIVLKARRERGYPVLRGTLAADGRLVLGPNGALILILDTGAQASVVGPESAHMLIRRRPPPPDLRLFGAGDARLEVVEMGTLVLAFAPSENPHAELAALPRRAIQLVRSQTGFRIGMVSRQASHAGRPAQGRRRQAESTPVASRGLPASETAQPPGIPVIDAAARLMFFDRPTFAAFQETTSGLRLACTRFVPLDQLDPTGIFDAFAAEATRAQRFTQRGCPLEGTAAGLQASISFIDLPGDGGAGSGARALAVLVELSTGYVWTYPMGGAGRKDLTLMITHFQRFLSQRRKWASGSAFLRSIEFSVAPQVQLPLEVCVTVEDECGRPQSTNVLLKWAPSRGLVVSPSECAAACLKLRAAYSLLRYALAPRLLEVLLEASRMALNARPSTRPTLQASRTERWYGHQPYVGAFLHAPGDLVETPAHDGIARTLGIYSCPAEDAGHIVFDLELGSRRIVPNVFGRATPFIVDMVRASEITGMFFADTPDLCYVRGSLGTPRWFGDDLGLATPAWLALRSLPGGIATDAGADGADLAVRAAPGSRAWFWNLGPSQAISYAPIPPSKLGRAKSRYVSYCSAATVGEYMRLHAAAVSGAGEGATRAEADFCYDFAHGLVRVLDPDPIPKTRLQMGEARAQADSLSQGDGVPDLVDLVVPPPSGEASLVIVSPSSLQAASASPQPTNGCTSLSPPESGSSDVNAVLREPDPPLTSVGAVGGIGLAGTIIYDTGACASVLGPGRDSGAARGAWLCGTTFASPSSSGGGDSADHLAVSIWADTDDTATACVD